VWKLYGPDGDGVYGSQQGLGGLEVLVTGAGHSIGLLQDHFGNVLGSVTNTTWAWNASRLSGYGPVDGLGVPALASTALTPEHLAWRGKWRDVTGDYYWGARPYDAKRRGFLSADPLGHGSDPALYGFCGGDAVNFWDPDGRGKNPAFEQDPVGGLLASMNQLNAAENSLIQLLAGAMAQSQADTVNGINAREAARNLAAQQWNQALLSRGIDQYVNSVAQAGQREAASAGWLANMQAASDAAGPGPELTLQQRWTSYVSSGRAAEHFERALKEAAAWSVMGVVGGLPGAGARTAVAAGERGLLRGAAKSADDAVRLFHGTTGSRASRIVGNEFYPTRGFRPGGDGAVFFAEDASTAFHFGREAAAGTGARSVTAIEFTMPRSLAQDLGLLNRNVLGEFRGACPLDIPGGTGFERIMTGGNIDAFNQALRNGTISTRRLRGGF
jgi:RHS repeat-associated protein